MPWTSSKEGTLPSLKNKSEKIREIFAEVANAALKRGLSEEEAIFSGLGAVNAYEKKNQVKKAVVPKPSHLQAVIEAAKLKKSQSEILPEKEQDNKINKVFLGKNAIDSDPERSLVSADWDKNGRLVLTFDDGEKIYTDPVPVSESIEQYVAITVPEQYDHIQFNTLADEAPEVGKLSWNQTDGTLNLGLDGGNVVLQIGQEQVVHIYNNTANAFSDLQVVRVTGSQGQRLTANLAQANSEITSSTTFAVVTEPIAKNKVGFATVSGLVRNVNTSAFPEGAALYLSPTIAGGLTATKPIAPNHMVLVGWCVRQHATVGQLYVHVQNGYELEELHNVRITSPLNGQILSYNSTLGIWENKSPEAASGVTTATYFAKVNTSANVPLTVTHNLALVDKDAFTFNAMLDGQQVAPDVSSVNTNSITITTNTSITNLAITVIGIKA